MRQLDGIWQEQQILLPRLTLDTGAPSKAASRMVIKIRNKELLSTMLTLRLLPGPYRQAFGLQESCPELFLSCIADCGTLVACSRSLL